MYLEEEYWMLACINSSNMNKGDMKGSVFIWYKVDVTTEKRCLPESFCIQMKEYLDKIYNLPYIYSYSLC